MARNPIPPKTSSCSSQLQHIGWSQLLEGLVNLVRTHACASYVVNFTRARSTACVLAIWWLSNFEQIRVINFDVLSKFEQVWAKVITSDQKWAKSASGGLWKRIEMSYQRNRRNCSVGAKNPFAQHLAAIIMNPASTPPPLNSEGTIWDFYVLAHTSTEYNLRAPQCHFTWKHSDVEPCQHSHNDFSTWFIQLKAIVLLLTLFLWVSMAISLRTINSLLLTSILQDWKGLIHDRFDTISINVHRIYDTITEKLLILGF
jgi:hypothetical protein